MEGQQQQHRQHPLEALSQQTQQQQQQQQGKKKVVLLTLPRLDVEPKTSTTTTGVAAAAVSCSSKSSSLAAAAPPLLLLQLPPGWTVRDLKGARFVATAASRSDGSSNRSQRCASLVVERKRISFSLQRVETSNALVLVPPLPPPHNNNNNKRLKVSNDNENTDVQLIPARLLNHGSGAWFLEGKPQPLVLAQLQAALQQHVVYNNLVLGVDNDKDDDEKDDDDDVDDSTTTTTTTAITAGRTVPSLALQFQCTQHEIHVGLAKLELAVLLPSTSSTTTTPTPTASYYGWLSEEASLLVREDILAALLEENDFCDYATTGIHVAKLVHQVVRRLQETCPQLQQQHAACLARHGILHLQNHDIDNNNNNDYDDSLDDDCNDECRLSVTKVAVWVARRLFTTQTSPARSSLEQQAFLTKWQSQLPGVGQVYTVRLSMLRGIAVSISAAAAVNPATAGSASTSCRGDNKGKLAPPPQHDDDDDDDSKHNCYWIYLPRDKLPANEAAAYMAQLFSAKEHWELAELQPYLEYLCDLTAKSQADILLQYTKIVVSSSSSTVGNDNDIITATTTIAVAGGPKGGRGGRRDVYVKR